MEHAVVLEKPSHVCYFYIVHKVKNITHIAKNDRTAVAVPPGGESALKDNVIVNSICECIKEKILSKEMFPGYRIVEDELSAELGVSRTPLRRALTKLQYEGFLYIVPNRGTYVVQFSPEEIAHIYEARLCLEEGIAPSLMERVTEEDIRDLKAIHEKIRADIHTMSPADYSMLNKEFHLRLVGISKNDHLKRFVEEIHNRVALLLIYYDNSSNSIDSVLRHEEMITALEQKNLDALIRAIRADSQLANYHS